tara:strand:- start:55 stop:423 length:369 start_codon:yes stop_codon:yes gene_type:complete
VKKTLIGLLIGVVLSSSFFLIKDFFTVETRVPKNHVTVRLLFETERKVDNVVLTSTYSNQKIQLNGQSETILVFPNPGEGEFKICCQFKDGQELCSQGHYVEAGYSPTLKIKTNEIETIDFY